jgi:hypothetical protein
MTTFVGFSATQRDLRSANGVTYDDVQEASDAIADKMIADIIGQLRNVNGVTTLPTMFEVGDEDAFQASSFLSNEDIRGWVGSPMFIFFGEERFFDTHIVGAQGGAYDTLAMLYATSVATSTLETPWNTWAELLRTAALNDIGLWETAALTVDAAAAYALETRAKLKSRSISDIGQREGLHS